MNCPICGNNIKNRKIDTEERGICEEHASCEDDSHIYSYKFEYGSWSEEVGDVIVIGSWKDTEEENIDKINILELAIKLAKKRYRKEEK